MKVKIKICGIRSLKAAKTAAFSGADFLGFNFVSTSKRYIDPGHALEIINSIRRKVKIVGVFQNAEIEYVNQISSNLELDFVQLHGTEDNLYISKLKKPAIKSLTENESVENVKAQYILLDRNKRGQGKMVNFKKAANLANNYPIFFSGGVTDKNVTEVIRIIKPFAVDVAGGIETNGIEDVEKIKLFIKNAKGAI